MHPSRLFQLPISDCGYADAKKRAYNQGGIFNDIWASNTFSISASTNGESYKIKE